MILKGRRAMADSGDNMDRKFRAIQTDGCFVLKTLMKSLEFRVGHITVVYCNGNVEVGTTQAIDDDFTGHSGASNEISVF